MEEEIKSFTSKKKEEKEEKEIRYSIEEIENGYIISKSKSWTDAKGNYKYENKKYFSKKNPFKEKESSMFDIMKSAIGDKE